jgi:cyclohexa-1,5-dienecarbonyl-CoA hydratase
VFPPAACALLPLRVGSSRAAVAILTGEIEDTLTWRQTGLLTLVAPAATLTDEVDRWFATHFARKSAAALRHATVAARLELSTRVRETLPILERLYLTDLMRTHDAVEGVSAFISKRSPNWTDR